MKPGKKRKPAGAEGKAPPNATEEIVEHARDRQSETPVDYSLTESLKIEIRFASDELSPPVDRSLLARYLKEEASEDEIEEVCLLVGTFKPWYDACSEMIRDGADT